MIDAIYGFLDKVFGPFILNYHPVWVIAVAGAIIGGFYTLIYYFFTDIEKQKKLQKLAKEVQREITEAQKSGDEKKLRKAQQKQMELMKMQSELMQQQIVPMLLTLPVFWIFFGWLRRWYVEVAIVKAPFNFFVFDFFHRMYHSALSGSELGYLGWYFLTSYAVGMILRKLLDMG